ncbi:MAG: hypothetical protein Q7S22_04085 [Candidatus Micrarchaeota archaeon]|nr:hypothetical protein [Candidatus Micrarchaeota archaeon]
MTFKVNGTIVEKEGGEMVARVERDEVQDYSGTMIFKLESNEIKNPYKTTIAKTEKGGIISTSGHELARVAEARRHFDNGNHLRDVEIAALWLWLCKGMR